MEPVIYLLAFGLGLGATHRRQRRRPRLRRVRRHRHGRHRGDLLERLAGDVRHLRQAPLPEHLRRDPRRAGRRRGAGHRGDALDRPAGRALRLLPAAGDDGSSASTPPGACCWCRSSASITALGFAGFGIAGRRDGPEDRPVQLRDHAGDHADVPGRGHLLPDRPAARVGRRSPPSSTPCTSSSSSSATRPSASRSTDLMRLGVLIVFALVAWRVAVNADDCPPDRLDPNSARFTGARFNPRCVRRTRVAFRTGQPPLPGRTHGGAGSHHEQARFAVG